MKLLIIMLALFTVLTSCKLTVKDEDDDDFDNFSIGGTCRVLDGGTMMNCIEFRDGAYTDASINQACSDYATDYGPEGADSNITSTSGVQFGCSSSDRVGICARPNYLIHYYDDNWGVGAAQSDCTSKGGTFI